MSKWSNNQFVKYQQIADGLAELYHVGQTDMSNRPYIEHCRQVSAWCFSWEAKVVALLHDIVEDTNCTYYDLIAAGLPPVVIQGVHDMTQQEHLNLMKGYVGGPPVFDREDLETYWARVKRNPVALEVKFADIRHNNDPVRMSKLPPERQAKLNAKYKRAIDFLLA